MMNLNKMKMSKGSFVFSLSIIFLLNLVLFVDVNTAVQGYVPINADIDRSDLPKNILVGSYASGRSHLKPMLDIAAVLIERGYNVTLITNGNYAPSSEYPTIKQIQIGPQLDFKKDLPGASDFINKEFDFRRLKIFREVIVKAYNESFEKYRDAAKDHNIDLFICFVMVNDACLDVAHSLKKPVVGYATTINVISPASYKSDPILHCNVSLEDESFFERFKCTVIRPIQMLYLMYPAINRLNDMRKRFNIEPVFMSAKRLSSTSLILVDTFFGFDLPQPLPPNVQEIGPVMSEEYPPLTPELSYFINEHERVLYVAFGTRVSTLVESNKILLQSFLEAINKKIIDGVIWALSQVLEDEFPSILVLDDGTQIQTSSILNNEHPHIHIIKFAPQFAVLNHTNTKLFLSHGGMTSTHESLYTGTPMLVMPFFGDQMGNAERLKLSGIALTLNKLDFNVDDVVSKMEILLKDEDVKNNVKRMKVLAKINSKRKYRAVDLIEYVLHSSNLGEGVNEESLKEWIPANTRMGFIRGNNYDVLGVLLSIILGVIGGIFWITKKLLKFIVRKIFTSTGPKPKRD